MSQTHKYFAAAVITALICMLAMPALAAKKEDSQPYNITRALEEMQAGNYAEAMEYADKEVSANPKSGTASLIKGVIFHTVEMYGNAIQPLDQAVKYLPKKGTFPRSDALYFRGKCYFALGDTVKALSDINEAVKLSPDDTDLYSWRGYLLFTIGDLDASDADFMKLLEINKSDTQSMVSLGLNEFTRGNYSQAAEWCDKALLLDSDYAPAYLLRADAYMWLKQFRKAADDIVSALQLQERTAFDAIDTDDSGMVAAMHEKLKYMMAVDASNMMWPYFEGQLYEATRDYENAIASYSAANKISPSAQAYNRMGQCYYNQLDFSTALECSEYAIDLDPDDINYKVDKASRLTMLGRGDEAIALLDELLAESSDDSTKQNLIFRRAMLKSYSGDFAGAAQDYTLYMASDAGLSDDVCMTATLLRGDCYRLAGNQDLAAADYNRVVELTKGDVANTGILLPYAYSGLGENGKALEVLQQYIAANEGEGDKKNEYYNAACVYARLGDSAKAMEYLNKAVDCGYGDCVHMLQDYDLAALRGTKEFDALFLRLGFVPSSDNNSDEVSGQAPIEDADLVKSAEQGTAAGGVTEIPFTRKGGVTEVKCHVNGLPLRFIFDTGAATVSISNVEATFMYKNGYIKDKDIIGTQQFIDATGAVSEGTIIRLAEVDLGGVALKDVQASVVNSQAAPLLLGQTVLARLGRIEIDNDRQVIRITPRSI